MRKMSFYVCPICGNILTSVGQGAFSCCGVTLSEEVPKNSDEEHEILLETVDQEFYVTMRHEMTKAHFLSFVAYVTANSVEIVKLYPEQEVSVRLRKKGHGMLLAYCSRHGMFRKWI